MNDSVVSLQVGFGQAFSVGCDEPLELVCILTIYDALLE